MAQSKRLSYSSAKSVSVRSPSPIGRTPVESEEWVKQWQHILTKDLVDSPVIVVDADTSVEEACELLISKDIHCLAIKTPINDLPGASQFIGLFDFADVNAFLTLAATRHTLHPEYLRENPRIEQIVVAAKAGPKVPVHLVSNLSEKNPLEILPHDATILSLLGVFSRGAHRVLIASPEPSTDFLGFVSDRRLLSWFSAYSQQTPSFLQYLCNPLSSLSLPSISLYASVVATSSTATVLDAMRLMSDEGVSSIAVIEEETGALLSAVSVTDVGKIVVPAESNHILSTSLQQLIAQIKEPLGSTDGAERYPVYSVLPTRPLSYAIEKLLVTNSHRLFITSDSSGSGSPGIPGKSRGHLCGIISIVDILSLFARVANIPNVDPTRMRRHRRASSASSQSSRSSQSGGDLSRSRSSSRTSLSPRGGNSVSSMDGSFMWSERAPPPSSPEKK